MGCGMAITGWDGFVTDNQFSGNGSHGFGCIGNGSTVMFTANRVEWNRGYGLYLPNGDTWNVTGNSFDRNWGAGLKTERVNAVTVTGISPQMRQGQRQAFGGRNFRAGYF